MKKRITALLLSVVLCLGMLSTAAFAAGIEAKGTEGQTTISVTGVGGKKLCALWGDKEFTKLLLLFYTDDQGKASVTVETELATTDTYYVGVEGQSKAEKVTIKAKEDKPTPGPGPSGPSGPSGSGSSGGSSSGSSTSSSNVTVKTPTNGKVSISPTSPKKGDKVTITLKPDEGYRGMPVVTDKDGNKLEITNLGGNKFSFVMPDGKVTVTATFTPVGENPFTDVADGAYYYDAVLWAVGTGVTAGTGDTTFSPDAPCTRAQIVTFLWRAAGSPAAKGENPFTDVAAGSYYYDAVQWAVAKGITAGTSATTFSPDMTCTRSQAVAFLYRYEKSPEVSGSNAFTDIPANAYYKDAVQWAVDTGVTVGTSATTFSPDMTCTRAQIVSFLYRDMVK